MAFRGYVLGMSTISVSGINGTSVSVGLHTEFDGNPRVDLTAFTPNRSPVIVSFADTAELSAALASIQTELDALPQPERKHPVVFAGTTEASEQERATLYPFLRVIDGGKKATKSCPN